MSENQQLTTLDSSVEEKAKERAEKALHPLKGTRTQATGRKALTIAIRSINNKRKAAGLPIVNEKEFTMVGAMSTCVLEYMLAIDLDVKSYEDRNEEMPADIRAGHARMLMGMAKEVAPYLERKVPSLSVEEIAKMEAGEQGDAMGSIMDAIRAESTANKLKALEESDAVRNGVV